MAGIVPTGYDPSWHMWIRVISQVLRDTIQLQPEYSIFFLKAQAKRRLYEKLNKVWAVSMHVRGRSRALTFTGNMVR